MKRHTILGAVLTGSLTLFLILMGLFGGGTAANTPGAGVNSAIPLRTDGTPIPLTSSNLLGRSLTDIGKLSQRTAQLEEKVRSGIPQILLVRSVTAADLPALGLACMPSGYTYEEPPYVLLIGA